jgi:hypothetical protein
MVPDVADSAVDLTRRVADLEAENRRLRQLLGIDGRLSVAPAWEPTLFTGQAEATQRTVNRRSPPEEKVALFRALFRGRSDVYALRWENAITGRSGWSPAVKGGWVNVRKPDREHLPLSDQVVSDHLGGVHHAGLYPLLDDDSCRLLAAISMDRAGRLTPWPILTRHGRRVCRPFWSGPDPATAAIHGYSSQTPCPLVRPDGSECFSSERP